MTPDETVNVTLILHEPQKALNDFWKYGPSQADPTDHWYHFLFDGTNGAVIAKDGGPNRDHPAPHGRRRRRRRLGRGRFDRMQLPGGRFLGSVPAGDLFHFAELTRLPVRPDGSRSVTVCRNGNRRVRPRRMVLLE